MAKHKHLWGDGLVRPDRKHIRIRLAEKKKRPGHHKKTNQETKS